MRPWSSASPRWKVNSFVITGCKCYDSGCNSKLLLTAETSQFVWGEGENGIYTRSQQPDNRHTLTQRNWPDNNLKTHSEEEPKEGHIFKIAKKHCLRTQHSFLTQGMHDCPPLGIRSCYVGSKRHKKPGKTTQIQSITLAYAYLSLKIRTRTFTDPLHLLFCWTSSKKIHFSISRNKSSNTQTHQGFKLQSI